MFQTLIENIASALEKVNLPYMIIGGQAVLLYGEPRLTKDIDITLGIGVNEYKKILSTITELNLKILIDNPESFINEFMVLPVIDEKSGIKIDFIFSFTLYEKDAIKRSKKVKLGKTMVNFASLEDVVIHKIIAGRARDLEDIRNILLKNQNFDKEHIYKWLKEFDKSLGENFYKRFEAILKGLKN